MVIIMFVFIDMSNNKTVLCYTEKHQSVKQSFKQKATC